MVKQFDPAERSDDTALEDRVREALRREAATVEPSGHSLQAIQARTAHGAAGRTRGRWYAGGAVLATAAAVAAIALVGTGDLGLGDGDTTAPAAPGQPAQTQALPIFYLDSSPERRGEPGSVTRDDPGLYREIHEVGVDGERVEAAVRELAGSVPNDADYTNPWQDVSVGSVDVQPREVVVAVNALPPAGPGHAAALQALAHTVQAAAETGDVVRVVVELDDGTTAATVTAGDPVSTYAGIWVTTPVQGATVDSPVTFSGLAATFEGNVAYEISRGDRVVASGATIAEGGMGSWSEWSFTERLQPGDYTVTAFDVDPALGGRRDVETKDFTVR